MLQNKTSSIVIVLKFEAYVYTALVKCREMENNYITSENEH